MNKRTSKTSTQIESKEKARKGASKKYTDLEADIKRTETSLEEPERATWDSGGSPQGEKIAK